MPVNRNALLRYKTIDLCLQNRYRRWTLEDLIDACSDALYEYEGIDKGLSRRTIQMDIQFMRSDKFGYNAPIVVLEKKYYTYEDPNYSIMNIPVSESDLNKLTETIEFLKQFKGFSHFRELDTMVQKLEDHVYAQKINRKPVIDFEKNENLKGLEFLEILYQSIIRKNVIELTYQSFNARQANTFLFYPYLLKEFRNRWFLIGSKNNNLPFLNLAIDRIVEVKTTDKHFIENDDFDSSEYFRHVIGVTVMEEREPENVVLFVTRKHAPYVLTKPFHPSQKLIKTDDYGITISLDVQHNFELEKEILGLGEGINVIAPDRLKASITGRLNTAIDQYNTILSEKGIITLKRKFIHKGFCTINQLYSRRSMAQLGLMLSKDDHHSVEKTKPVYLGDTPAVSSLLLNSSVVSVIAQIIDHPEIKSVFYYQGIPDNYFEFIQIGEEIRMLALVLVSEMKSDSFTLQVIPGTHHKYLGKDETNCIVENCIPVECTLNLGGAILFDPLILKRFPEQLKTVKTQFMMIEFV
jgi:predicted DNA-binding transcriptional regulator YafY